VRSDILIVDDDESIREMMDVVLTQAGFQVAVASNGETALDLVKRSRFGLMLLDVHMPHMSGLDVLATMKRFPWTPRVLMVTADSQSTTVRQAMTLGCLGYVVKPFKPGALVERVRYALTQPLPPLMI